MSKAFARCLAVFLQLSISYIAGADPPMNDDCANAIPAFIGDNPFSTIDATTDGPPHTACLSNNNNQVSHDIWFRFTATQDAAMVFSTCSSDFNSRIALYEGCQCPVTSAMLVTCSDDVCGEQAAVFGFVEVGTCYTIRIGGFGDAQGTGTVAIVSVDQQQLPCGQPDHNCCTPGLAGCNDAGCCSTVCKFDSFCCDRQWDMNCVQLAEELCGIYCLYSCESEQPHSCFVTGGPACDDPVCCENVCCIDPYCCAVAWDESCVALSMIQCVEQEDVFCPPNADLEGEPCGQMFNERCGTVLCNGSSGDCCESGPYTGCTDISCAIGVCLLDPFCCDIQWDNQCALQACSSPYCSCDPYASDNYISIDCGESVCGQLFSHNEASDHDVFIVNAPLPSMLITFAVDSKYPVRITLQSNECHDVKVLAISGLTRPAVASAAVDAGCWAIVEPIGANCLPCGSGMNSYVATVTCKQTCPGEANGDQVVDVDDLLAVINWWGPCGVLCYPDFNNDKTIDVDDLLTVINNWGPCD